MNIIKHFLKRCLKLGIGPDYVTVVALCTTQGSVGSH